jgi:hypothetical protein
VHRSPARRLGREIRYCAEVVATPTGSFWITEGKDNRREEMMVIVLFYRTNLPCSVETRSWHVRIQGLLKP